MIFNKCFNGEKQVELKILIMAHWCQIYNKKIVKNVPKRGSESPKDDTCTIFFLQFDSVPKKENESDEDFFKETVTNETRDIHNMEHSNEYIEEDYEVVKLEDESEYTPTPEEQEMLNEMKADFFYIENICKFTECKIKITHKKAKKIIQDRIPYNKVQLWYGQFP